MAVIRLAHAAPVTSYPSPFMPIASFFRPVACPLRLLFAALLAATTAAFAQSPSAADGFDPNVDGNVYALAAQADGRLILGGQFATLHPSVGIAVGRNNLARVNADGSADLGFDPNANGPVRAVLLQPDGKILIGGDFTAVGGVTRNRVARLNTDGTLDATFSPNVGGTAAAVNALLVLPDGRVVIGGSFTSVGGVTRNRIARLSATGVLDATWDPNFNNIVFALAQYSGGKIIVGGAFTSLQPAGASAPTGRGRLARLNADGTPDSEFDGGANSSVYAIAVQRDGHILVGGAFSTVQPIPTPNSQVRLHLLRLQPDGQFDSLFNANVGGDVNAIVVQPDGSILVGGTFSTAWASGNAPSSRSFIARFSADGALDTTFTPFANQAVKAIAVLPDSKIAIGGYFTRISTPNAPAGVLRNRLARLGTDGTLDTTFSIDDGGRPLVSLVQSDGKILIGGTFTTAGGLTRNGMARLNADGTLDAAFNPNLNGRVLAMALQADGKILIGGAFTTVGGVTRNYFARLNANGTLDTAVDPAVGSQIEAIAVQSDGKILIGGEFTTLAPTTTTTTTSTPNAANSTTTSTTTNGVSTTVTVTTSGGVTTTVTTINATRGHIARLNTDGSIDTTFNPDASNTVFAIVPQSDGKILIGGAFTTLQPNGATLTTARQGIARLNADGTLDTAYNPEPSGSVVCIAVQSDGKAVIGGTFASFPIPNVAADATVTRTVRNRLARVNTDGTIDATFDPNANSIVNTLAIQSDGKILVGGAFTTFQPNGAADWTLRKYAARLNADGTLDATFNLDLDERSGNNVTLLRLQADGKILMCGGFLSLQPIGATARINRSHFIRLNAAGTLDAAFNPAASGPAPGTINTIAIQVDGKIVVAGAFADLGGASTPNIARFTPEGTLDTGFSRATGADGAINAVALRPNTAGLTPQLPGFAWLDATGALRTTFRPGSNVQLSGQVSCFAFQTDGSLILGGSFSNLAGGTTNNLIRFNPDGSLDTSFTPAPDGPVDAIWVQLNGRILIAGGFTNVSATLRNRVARLNSDGSLDAFDPNANGRVSTVMEQPNGQILLAGQFTTLQPNGFTNTTTTTATSTANDKNSTTTVTNADGSTTTTTVTVASGTTTTTIVNSKGQTPVTRNYLARVTGDGDIDTAFNPNPGSVVNAVVVQSDGKIVFGGLFTTVAPTVTTTTTTTPNAGSSTTTKTNADGSTTTTTISTTSGTTTTSVTTSSTRNFLARVNAADGSLDTTYDPNPNAAVNALALQPDGKVLVGGQFTLMGTTPRNNIARINTDGGTDAAFDPNANAQVTAIAVQPDGRILLSGAFTTIQPAGAAALTRSGLARVTAAGALDSAFDPNPNGFVIALGGRSDGSVLLTGTFTALQPGGVMYVGGAFGNLGGIAARGLVALNSDGSAYSGFAPNPNGDVNALLIQPDGKLVVGGTFTNIAGATRNRIARFNADGTLDTAFNPNLSGAVRSLALQPDGKILAGGAFTGASGVIRLNANGTTDATFNTTIAAPVTALIVQSDGQILCVSNQSQLSRLNASGGFGTPATGVNQGAPGLFQAIALQADGGVLVGGNATITEVGGVSSQPPSRSFLARLTAGGRMDTSFNPAPDGAVTALALQSDGRLIFGGAFKNVGDLPRSTLARVAAAGTAAQSLTFGAGGTGAQRNIVWVRDGTAPELSSASFEISSDARNWTTLAASGRRPAGGRGWETGLVTVPIDAPFYIRTRGLVASGTGTSGVVEFRQQFNLSPSAGLGGTASAGVTASAIVDAKTGQPLFVQTSSAGNGDFVAAGNLGQTGSPDAVGSVTPPGTVIATGGDARLANLSVRARVTAATPLIAGFAISGTTPRTVLLRGVGPSLGVFGVSGPLPAPRLRLFDAGGKLLLENNGWAATPASVAEVGAAMAHTGAFPLAANSGADAAAVVTLAPGAYSVQVLDPTGTGGVALAEIYDADTATTSRLTNISTRSSVTAADGAFISGFVIAGTASKNLLVRGLGPALTQFNVTGTLADPVVSLFDAQGRLITANDNWSNATSDGFLSANTAALTALSAQVSAFPLNVGSADAALSITVGPGAYTVQVNGAAAGATGAAMIEIYELP